METPKLIDIFEPLEKLFYVKTDNMMNVVEANSVFSDHIQMAGIMPFDLKFLVGEKDHKKICLAAKKAKFKNTSTRVSVKVKHLTHYELDVNVQVYYFQDEFVFVGWEIKPDEKGKILRELAYMMSHIIRKPAANLLGLIPMIERTANNIEILNHVDNVIRELDAGIKSVGNVIFQKEQESSDPKE